MPCNISLRDLLEGNPDAGGIWTFEGYNVSSNYGPWSSVPTYLNINDQVGVSDNPLVDVDSINPGFYKYKYSITSNGRTSEAYLVVQVVEFCVERDVDNYPQQTATHCITGYNDPVIQLSDLIMDDKCTSLYPGGIWTQDANDTHQVGAALDPINGSLNISRHLSTNSLPDSTSRSYMFYYDVSSALYGETVSINNQDCRSCKGKLTLNVSKPQPIALSNPPYASFDAMIQVGVGPVEGVDFLLWSSFVTNTYPFTYFGEGPDVGGCGANPVVQTTLNDFVGVLSGAYNLEVPLNCGDRLTYNFSSNSIDLGLGNIVYADLPDSSVFAFHMCTALKTSDCYKCQTIYVVTPPF